MSKLIAFIAGLSVSAKYVLVLALMTVQSACVPIPSEIIMPFAGSALAHSQWQLVILATLASLASNLGSMPAYWVGAKGGRPMVERFGGYVLLSKRDLDIAEHFFAKFGSITVLVGRMLPIVRTFIASSCRNRQDESGSLSCLHVHRFVAMVLRVGSRRHAPR